MLEELKMILNLLEGMPSLAMWALVFFLGYKLTMYLAVTGTIYKLVSLAFHKIHDMYVFDKPIRPPRPIINRSTEMINVVKERDGLNDLTVNAEAYGELLRVLKRVRVRVDKPSTRYLHPRCVVWIEEAIEAKLYLEAQEQKASDES